MSGDFRILFHLRKSWASRLPTLLSTILSCLLRRTACWRNQVELIFIIFIPLPLRQGDWIIGLIIVIDLNTFIYLTFLDLVFFWKTTNGGKKMFTGTVPKMQGCRSRGFWVEPESFFLSIPATVPVPWSCVRYNLKIKTTLQTLYIFILLRQVSSPRWRIVNAKSRSIRRHQAGAIF